MQSFSGVASSADSEGAGNRNYRWFSPKICHCQFIKNKSHSLPILRQFPLAPLNYLCKMMLWFAQALLVSACHLLDIPTGSENISSHWESVLSLCPVDSQLCPYFCLLAWTIPDGTCISNSSMVHFICLDLRMLLRTISYPVYFINDNWWI